MGEKEKKSKSKKGLTKFIVYMRDEIMPALKGMWLVSSFIWGAFWYSLRYLWYKENKWHVILYLIGGYVGIGWLLTYLRWYGIFMYDVEWFDVLRATIMYVLVLVVYHLRLFKPINRLQSYLDISQVGGYWKYYGFPIYLEEKWVKIANILNVSLDFSQIQIDCQKKLMKIKLDTGRKDNLISIKQVSLSDELLISCYLLPVPNHDKRNVYVSVEGYIYIYMPALIEDRFEELEKYLKENGEYENMIKGLVEKIGRQSKIEQLVSEKLKSDVARKHAQRLIEAVVINKKNWKFKVVDVQGNQNYLSFLCRLEEYQTIENITKIKSELESVFRSKVIVKELKDKRMIRLVVLVEEELSSFERSTEQLNEINSKQEFYIGESLTGTLTAKWNLQANHFWIGGMSGSGKSVQMKNILVQLAQLTDSNLGIDYRTMFLTSSSKIADFVEFGKAGALVTSGVDNQIKVFEYVLEELERREKLFYDLEVENIQELNETYPDLRMKQWVLLADEYENTRNGLDKKQSEYAERLLSQILNIGRSAGCVVIIGTQSILKGSVGNVADKLTVKFSGYNEHNVWVKESPVIAKYFQVLEKQPQGVFFFKSQNLKPEQQVLLHDRSYMLIQTPFVKDIEVNHLPKLLGKNSEYEIFNDCEPLDSLEDVL